MNNFQVGDKVWSSRYGEGVVNSVIDDHTYCVVVDFEDDGFATFTADGKEIKEDKYPSLFFEGAYIIDGPAPVREKEKPEFKPFDKVLVRNKQEDPWRANIYSHYRGGITPYQCVSYQWLYCIPFEGNENLVGTTDNPS
jgi:hypothetical protein